MNNLPIFASLLGAVLLAGCAGNLKLVEDGKVHHGTYSQVSKTLEFNIDGIPYQGTYVQGLSAGIGVGLSGAVGSSAVFMSDGSGQALLTSPDGRVLRCVFGPVVGWRGQGRCLHNDGKSYDLLIGQ